MNLITEVIITLSLTALGFASGLYIGQGQKEVQVVEKKGDTQVIYKDRIVTVTKTIQKDGTVTETTKTEDKDINRNTHTVDTEHLSTPVKLAQYRLGVSYWFQYNEILGEQQSHIFDYRNQVSAVASRRLLGPVWVDLYLRKQEAAVGLSLEF